MQSGNNLAAQMILSSCADQQIELVIEGAAGCEHVALRLSTWAEGLGWCTQKTIRLEAEQLDELHRATTVARHRLAHRRVDSGLHREPAQVIQLPIVA
ncbi:MAG: hypothetical protein H7Z38_06945 [Rubrivivax sp.]|nr:hypothetical protein [Pyrinomonadaceae bacterium]